MTMFGPKNIFPCTDCTKETIQELQEEISNLQTTISSGPQSIYKHLSKSDLQNLHNTPIILIPAVTGKAIEVISVIFAYNFVSTAYNGNSPNIRTTNAGATWGNITIASAANSFNGYMAPISTTNTLNSRWLVNENLIATVAASMGSGDGTLDLYILYRYINIQ
jgi:hypothetical protein